VLWFFLLKPSTNNTICSVKERAIEKSQAFHALENLEMTADGSEYNQVQCKII